MKKIVAAVDFSANSKRTIRFAMQLASQIEADITFLHVIGTLAPNVNVIADYSFYAHFQKEDAEHKLHLLQKLVKSVFAGKLPQKIKYSCVCELGDEISTKIIDYARLKHADFICVGARDNNLLTKIFGSVATHLITASPIPVFVVPKSYIVKQMHTICYASDMANLETEMIQVSKLAFNLNAKLNVLHFQYSVLLKENGERLNHLAKKFETDKVSFQYKKLSLNFPLNDHLRKAVAASKPSLLVLFTKQDRTWFQKLILSSKSAEFSFTAKVPLLVYRKAAK